MKTHEATASFETNEHEKSQEQSPQEFVQSLTIFDSYVEVTADMTEQPEYQMTFNDEEQALVEGLRHMLESLAADAMDHDQTVTINELFNMLDGAILASKEAVADDIRDQLLLVATKMRYNLQVRFNRGVSKVSNDRAGRDSAMRDQFDASFARSYADLGSLFKGRVRFDQADYTPFESPIEDHEVNEVPESTKDYQQMAQKAIYEKTDGRRFEELNAKEQGRVRRRLARDLHPDAGGDEDLYKHVTEMTADHKNDS